MERRGAAPAGQSLQMQARETKILNTRQAILTQNAAALYPLLSLTQSCASAKDCLLLGLASVRLSSSAVAPSMRIVAWPCRSPAEIESIFAARMDRVYELTDQPANGRFFKLNGRCQLSLRRCFGTNHRTPSGTVDAVRVQ